MGLFTLYVAKQDRRKRGCMLILKTPYQKGRYVFFFVDPSRKLFQFVYKLALNRKLKENLFYWQYSVKQISGIKLGVETLMFEQLESKYHAN